ncbi:MAG: hypothetical protein L0G25_00670 [Psychrobacter sp.]|nr:hypothetical protein [Psychrobacter sp.]
MSKPQEKTIEDYRHLALDGPLTLELTQDQQAVILKTYDYGLNKLTDVDEMLLSSVIRQMKEAIDPENPLANHLEK